MSEVHFCICVVTDEGSAEGSASCGCGFSTPRDIQGTGGRLCLPKVAHGRLLISLGREGSGELARDSDEGGS
jgi:hypothetical protein